MPKYPVIEFSIGNFNGNEINFLSSNTSFEECIDCANVVAILKTRAKTNKERNLFTMLLIFGVFYLMVKIKLLLNGMED